MDNNRGFRNDLNLISRIQAGDKEAFAKLYRAYFISLCEFVHKYVDMPAVCEELVQDLFLNIWRKRDKWDPKGTPRSYLYKGARNRALDYLKHLEVERDYLEYHKIEREEEWESLREESHQMMQPETLTPVSDQLLIEAVDHAIGQLPVRRKLIFLMSREDGLTYREIADVLGISVKTVETQMGRSLKTLRSLLSEHIQDF